MYHPTGSLHESMYCASERAWIQFNRQNDEDELYHSPVVRITK